MFVRKRDFEREIRFLQKTLDKLETAEILAKHRMDTLETRIGRLEGSMKKKAGCNLVYDTVYVSRAAAHAELEEFANELGYERRERSSRAWEKTNEGN